MAKKIVVAGGGFGGFYALKTLSGAELGSQHEIVLLDSSDKFVYLPSLPYLLSGKKTVEDITEPFDKISKRLGIEFRKGEVTGISFKDKQIFLRDNDVIEYDYLIIAIGAQVEYFGIPGAENTIPSWRLEHYLEMQKIIASKNDIKIGIVGGGLTGVEIAGELAERLGGEKITIIEKMPYLLPTLNHQKASLAVENFLKSIGVNIVKGDGVKKVEGSTVTLESGQSLEFDAVIWSVGIRAPRLKFDLPVETSGRGWIAVNPNLTVKGVDNVYAVGDITYFAWNSDCAMKMAEEAILQGKTAAKNIMRQLQGLEPSYVHRPIFLNSRPKSLCSVGFNKAVMVWESKILFGRTAYISKMLIENIVMRDIKGKVGGGIATSLESTILKTISRV